MSALALAGSANRTDFTDEEEALTRIGRVSGVFGKMRDEPHAANIGNCERSLMEAAHMIGDLWNRVQREKARRASLPAQQRTLAEV